MDNIVKSFTALELKVIERLKSHDWYHSMSDSNEVHFKGEKDMREIEEMLSLFDFKKAASLYNEHSPNSFPDFVFKESQHEAGKKRVADKLSSGKLNLGV